MKEVVRSCESKTRALVVFAVAAILAAAMACAIPAGQAHAKGVTLENAKGIVHIYESDYGYSWYGISSTNWNIKKEPTGIKLSNKKVCTAESSYGAIDLYFAKPGKTTLSYKWKGKTHKVVFVFHKWKSPVKSFKVNGRQYAGKFKRGQFVDVDSKVLSGKVSVKAAKGWKFERIEAEGWTKNYDLKITKVKNGKTLAKSKKMQCVIAWFANKKSGQEVPVILKWKEYCLAD